MMFHDELASIELPTASGTADRKPPQRASSRCASRKPQAAAAIQDERRIEVVTHAGTHVFSAFDRLWVRGNGKSESRPATQLSAGDLVAFLGRVVAVRVVESDS